MRIKILPFFYLTFCCAWLSTFFITNTSFSSGNPGATCSSSGCHGNITDGTITFTGIPTNYIPNTAYPVTLCVIENDPTLAEPQIEAAGFTVFLTEISDGSWTSGSGSYIGGSNNLSVTHSGKRQLSQFEPSSRERACWSFTWNAPASGNGTANFTFRGNAVDCNFSSSNDHGGYFGSTSSAETVLPIELIDFNVKTQSRNIILNWQTATEHQNDFFEIQRSTDGSNFKIIGKVDGAGESHELLAYEFVDENADLSQRVYYRLKQVDFSGSFSFSNIELIENEDYQNELTLYPNPTNGRLTIIKEREFESFPIEIRNTSNQLIRSEIILNNQLELDISDLTDGLYFITYLRNGKLFSKKVMKSSF